MIQEDKKNVVVRGNILKPPHKHSTPDLAS